LLKIRPQTKLKQSFVLQDGSIHPAGPHAKFYRAPESSPKFRNANLNDLQSARAVINDELDLPAQLGVQYHALRILRIVDAQQGNYHPAR